MPRGSDAAHHVHDSVEAKGAGAHVREAGEKPEHEREEHDKARDLMRKERESGDRAKVCSALSCTFPWLDCCRDVNAALLCGCTDAAARGRPQGQDGARRRGSFANRDPLQAVSLSSICAPRCLVKLFSTLP
jgi:hypothetical protein